MFKTEFQKIWYSGISWHKKAKTHLIYYTVPLNSVKQNSDIFFVENWNIGQKMSFCNNGSKSGQ